MDIMTIKSKDKMISLEIFDPNQGVAISKIVDDFSISIDASPLKSGYYVVKVQIEGGKYLSKRFYKI
jgi:hypothetical protein